MRLDPEPNGHHDSNFVNCPGICCVSRRVGDEWVTPRDNALVDGHLGCRNAIVVCVSISRSQKNRAPIYCLPSDGTLELGVPVSVGSHTDLSRRRTFRMARCWERVTSGGPGSGIMHHAGTPSSNTPSKGEQCIGALLFWERSIKTQTVAVFR